MKFYIILLCTSGIIGFSACSGNSKSVEERRNDSMEEVEMKQVDQIRHNEDSLMKEKEKELLEKYK